MAITGIENSFNAYANYKSRTKKSSSASFAAAANNAGSQKESVVDEFRKKHPDQAGTVNKQVNAGKAVLKEIMRRICPGKA